MPNSLRLKLLLRTPGVRIALSLFVAAFLLYAWNALVYTHQQARLQELRDEKASIERRVNEAREAKRLLPALAKQQRSLNASLLRYRGALPKTVDPPELIQRLTGYANGLDLEISKVERAQTKPPTDKTKSYGLRLSMKGNFPALLDYLARIDGDPQFLIVAPPSFKAAGDGAVTTSLQITALYDGGIR